MLLNSVPELLPPPPPSMLLTMSGGRGMTTWTGFVGPSSTSRPGVREPEIYEEDMLAFDGTVS